MRFALRIGLLAAALACAPIGGVLAADDDVAAPAEHRRGAEQTFLTYPEWFLVFSPAEYAAYVRQHAPTRFPFLGHVDQFWESYGAVYDATREDYPFNAGYHVMILTIGVSTTVEYALRAAYETLVGRLSALTLDGTALTEEDRYGARVAQEYVDFIRVRPWYEFDFRARLGGLWRETGWWGKAPLRKWERKYALTTEYAIKAAYGWLIGHATAAGYEPPLPVTAVLLDRLPRDVERAMPQLTTLRRLPDGSVLATLPRYEPFTHEALALAGRGVRFREIAGNRTVILVSVLAPEDWRPERAVGRVLFAQPALTEPGLQRVALVVPVADLSGMLIGLRRNGARPEHVFDY
jgi:hypothetical protein